LHQVGVTLLIIGFAILIGLLLIFIQGRETKSEG
jgi:hypothetical protein